MTFGSFGAEKPKTSQEDADLIARVMEQAPEEQTKKHEGVVPDGPDANLHLVKSGKEIVAERNAAANPHGFSEVPGAPSGTEKVDEPANDNDDEQPPFAQAA